MSKIFYLEYVHRIKGFILFQLQEKDFYIDINEAKAFVEDDFIEDAEPITILRKKIMFELQSTGNIRINSI